MNQPGDSFAFFFFFHNKSSLPHIVLFSIFVAAFDILYYSKFVSAGTEEATYIVVEERDSNGNTLQVRKSSLKTMKAVPLFYTFFKFPPLLF